MRVLAIAGIAALVILSVAAPATACSGQSMRAVQATSADLSAATKKPIRKTKGEKVEYMRAVPMK